MGCCPSSEKLQHELPSPLPHQAEKYVPSFKSVVYTIMASKPHEVPDKRWLSLKRPRKNLQPNEGKVPDRRLTVLKHKKDEVERMRRRTILMDTRLRSKPQAKGTSRPNVGNNLLYTDQDFPFDVAMHGEENINDIKWMRPKVSFATNALF